MTMPRSENDQAQVNYNRLYPNFTPEEIEPMVSLKRTLKDGRVIPVKLLNLKDPLIHTMIKTRQRAVERARQRGIDRRRFLIENTSKLRRAGIQSIWDLIREYEKRFPGLGNSPKAPKKNKTKVTDKDIIENAKKRGLVRKPVYDQSGNIVYHRWVKP
jgi:hypothetical protein